MFSRSINDNFFDAGDPRLQELRRRIGWICQTLRYGAPIAYVWGLIFDIANFSDRASWSKRAAYIFQESALRPLTDWQLLALYATTVPERLALLGLAYYAWLLFSGYLTGRIFTINATRNLQLCGIFGVAGVILDNLTRPLVLPILAATRPAGVSPGVHISYIMPIDLHSLIFYVGLIGLAQIQKVAAEIYTENGQIL